MGKKRIGKNSLSLASLRWDIGGVKFNNSEFLGKFTVRFSLALWMALIGVVLVTQALLGLNGIDALLLAVILPFSVDCLIGILAILSRVLKWKEGLFCSAFFSPRVLAAFILLIGAKLAWLVKEAPGVADCVSGGADQDLLARKQFLENRIINTEFGANDSPGFLSQEFR